MPDAIKNRSTQRRFHEAPVSDEDITLLLEAARNSQSARNTQPWRFIVVRDDKTREALVKVNHEQTWMLKAPVFIVVVADISVWEARDPEAIKEIDYVDESSSSRYLKAVIRDSAIAADHISLQAEHMGLGTAWTAWFLQKDVRPILGIPDDKFVVGIIAVGHYTVRPRPIKKKPLDGLVMYERWQD